MIMQWSSCFCTLLYLSIVMCAKTSGWLAIIRIKTFTNFLTECGSKAPDKYHTLINYVSHNVYEYIEDCDDYDSALEVLDQLFIKKPNEIFARHLLATRQQKPGETVVEFL